ncbi:MAG: glycosyltransferase family 1 protein [Microgenomates group bacterium]
MPKKYNIAIDVSPLSDGNSTRGVGYYTKNLVAALHSEVKTNPLYKNFSIHLIQNSKFEIKNFDLVHYPYFDPFFLTLPPKKNIPQIITIHDLIPLEFPQHFPVGIRGYIKWLIQKYRAKMSDYIITVSHHSKYAISDILRYPVDQIYVTYEGANSSFQPISDKNQLSLIKKKYSLPDKFILYVGDINWNKNIRTLVNACQKLNYHLIIVGSSATKKVTHHPWTQDILWLQGQNSPYIHCLGFISDLELPYIYNLATIYCQPSFAEGFGLPLIEAMQSGTPIVYSRSTSLPELAGDCGLSFDPLDQISLEKSLTRLWNNPTLRQQQTKKGLHQSLQFKWQYTAIQTLALYDLALTS